MKKSLAVATLAFGAASAAWAQPVQVRPLLGLGFTFGGDTIAQADYDNGDSEKVRAGGLIALTTGVELQFSPLVSTQLLVGYHADNISNDSGKVRFDRVPIEALGHYRLTDWLRIGGGARYSTRARIRSSGTAAAVVPSEELKDTLGAVVEGEFTIGRNLGIKLRYVSEKFKSETFPGAPDIKGNHVGVYLVGYFF